jgi:hypothetical protein
MVDRSKGRGRRKRTQKDPWLPGTEYVSQAVIDKLMHCDAILRDFEDPYEKPMDVVANIFELTRVVNVEHATDKDGRTNVLATDDWHCPLMLRDERGDDGVISQGMPTYPCAYSDKPHDNPQLCDYMVNMFTFNRWPWIDKEKQKLSYYVRCSWPFMAKR